MMSNFSIRIQKKLCYEFLCLIRNTLTKDFCHHKTQCLTGSYHPDKLNLVILAIKIKDHTEINTKNVTFCKCFKKKLR